MTLHISQRPLITSFVPGTEYTQSGERECGARLLCLTDLREADTLIRCPCQVTSQKTPPAVCVNHNNWTLTVFGEGLV